jgi:hypothetical protein
MKRRTEHLVEKRDGRREFLRATKLARSVHLALYEIGVDEDWRALELASVVLEGLRQKRKASQSSSPTAMPVGGPVVLTTTEIADSVQHLLVVTGQPTAAVAYGAVQVERARRRQVVGIGGAASNGVTSSGVAGTGANPSRMSVSSVPKAGRRTSKSGLGNTGPGNTGPESAGPESSGSAKSGAAAKPNVKPTNRIWGEG